MSGQKDVTINAIDPALLRAQQQQQRELEERQRATAAMLQEADRKLAAARARAEQVAGQANQLRQNAAALEDDVADTKLRLRELKRTLERMKTSTLEAQKEAGQLGDSVAADAAQVRSQISQLEQSKRALEQQLQEALELVRGFASETVSGATEALEAAAKERDGLLREMSALLAQIKAHATSGPLGVVLQQMLKASEQADYHVSAAYIHQQEIEIFITNQQQETIRIAASLSASRVEELTKDANLRLVLEGQNQPNQEACIVDTLKLVERLRELGVQATIRVDSAAPGFSGAPVSAAREKERG